MKRWATGFLILTIACATLVGCGAKKDDKKGTSESTNGKENVETIRLGVMPSTDNIPFLIAHQQGFDKKQGVNIKLEVFKSAPDRDAALQAGEVDGVISDLVGVAIYQQGGLDVKIIGAPYDQFDLVTADDTVKTVSDLKGKEVAFSQRTGTAFAVDKMLEKAGLTVKDIKVQEIPQVPTRLELVGNGKAAAAILPEPFVTMAKAQGMRVLQSTTDIGVQAFAIGFPAKVIDKKGQAIKGMVDAYNEGSVYVKENDKEKYIDLFIKDVGFPESLKEAIDIPDYGELEPIKEADVTAAFEWAKEAGLLKNDITPKDVISNVYFK